MKTKSYFLVFSIFALALFTSCDPNAVDGNTNYWNSSTLVRLHFFDKVKTVTTDNGMYVSNFNQDGFITSTVYNSGTEVSTTTYNYSKDGVLTTMDFAVTGGTSIGYSTTYEYANTGKYIVHSPFHLQMDGLIPNLSSISNKMGTTTYTFSGNVMTMITVSGSAGMFYNDTAKVTYNGSYPASITHGTNYVKNMKFASNGMFTSYNEGFSGDYASDTKFYFKADNTFMLVDSMVQNTVSNGITTKMVKKYTYDSNKNVTLEESPTNSTKYEYVYDSHKNWTTKTTRYKYQGATEWGAPYTETRTLTYW